jgi:HSP20 family protein
MEMPMKVTDLLPWSRGKRGAPGMRGEGGNAAITMQSDIHRAFENLWHALEQPTLSSWGRAFAAGLPRVDVHEDDKALEVVAELPGMERKDVDISMTDGFLTIRGNKKIEREEEDEGYVLRERSFGQVERVVPLPEGLDLNSAKAKFRNGALTITIPKAERSRREAKRIPVNRG